MAFSFVKLCFILLYIGFGAITVLALPYVRKKDGVLGNNARIMLILSAVAATAYIFAFLIPQMQIANILYSVFFGSCTFFLLIMADFVILQTGLLAGFRMYILVPAYVLSVMDALSLFYNNVYQVFFTVSIDAEPYVAGEFYSVFSVNPLMYIHIAWNGILSAAIVVLLVIKTLQVPTMYKNKYSVSLGGFVVVAAACAFGFWKQSTWGFLGLTCILNALFTFYYGLRYHYARLSGDLLPLAAQNLQNGFMVFDTDGNCIYANDYAKNMFELDDESTSDILKNYLAERLPEKRYETLEEGSVIETKQYDSKNLLVESDYQRLYDSKERFVGFMLMLNDREKSVQEVEAHEKAEGIDKLTSLYNKEGFEKKVRELLDGEPDVKRTIVCCDIKDFKQINASFGQGAANGMLVNLGQILSKACEGTDSVPARLYADRFALCIRSERYSDILFSDMARTALKLPNNKFYKVVCYVGVYDEADPTLSVEEMCKRALMAAESIKGDYNKLLVHYDEKTMHENRERENAVINELRKAIDEDQFKAYLQPQVNPEDKQVLGGEVLVRWVHPKKGMINPGNFLPLFERTGLITLLDKCVWTKACETLNRWREEGNENRYLSVNVSPTDFLFMDVYKEITAIAENTGVTPSQLIIEIPESSVMQDFENRIQFIEKLNDYGFRTALDNVGKGIAGLEKLKDIPTGIVKIDHSLLKKAFTDKKSEQAIKTIVELCHESGKQIVAEGVESQAHVDMLKEFGCDLLQGFFYAKPMPIDEFEVMYFEISEGEGEESEIEPVAVGDNAEIEPVETDENGPVIPDLEEETEEKASE